MFRAAAHFLLDIEEERAGQRAVNRDGDDDIYRPHTTRSINCSYESVLFLPLALHVHSCTSYHVVFGERIFTGRSASEYPLRHRLSLLCVATPLWLVHRALLALVCERQYTVAIAYARPLRDHEIRGSSVSQLALRTFTAQYRCSRIVTTACVFSISTCTCIEHTHSLCDLCP